MPYLKVYEWERNTWPEFRYLQLNREEQQKLLKKLSNHFKVSVPSISQSHSRGATYHRFIEVCKFHKTVELGTVIHEFSHHLNWKKYNEIGHRKSFKKCLKRVYTWSKRYLPKENEAEQLYGSAKI